MRESCRELLEGNQRWVAARLEEDPNFFKRLARGQKPKYLWIGCADSRVPATQITDMPPGEIFVHRNVANLVVPSDLNMLSVVEFAVGILAVQDIIVCGHYGCGGVEAALENRPLGLVDHWLAHIRRIRDSHAETLNSLDFKERFRRLVELNVAQQVEDLSRLPGIRRAWRDGKTLRLHGWVYSVEDGILRDLEVSKSG